MEAGVLRWLWHEGGETEAVAGLMVGTGWGRGEAAVVPVVAGVRLWWPLWEIRLNSDQEPFIFLFLFFF